MYFDHYECKTCPSQQFTCQPHSQACSNGLGMRLVPHWLSTGNRDSTFFVKVKVLATVNKPLLSQLHYQENTLHCGASVSEFVQPLSWFVNEEGFCQTMDACLGILCRFQGSTSKWSFVHLALYVKTLAGVKASSYVGKLYDFICHLASPFSRIPQLSSNLSHWLMLICCNLVSLSCSRVLFAK